MSAKGCLMLFIGVAGLAVVIIASLIFGSTGLGFSLIIVVIIAIAFYAIIPGTLSRDPSKQRSAIYSKVVGVTFNNDDGTNRQKIIKKECSANDDLELLPYTYNSAPAIKVLSKLGNQIGNIKADLAKDIYDNVLKDKVKCIITEVTGGSPDFPTRGVNIVLLLTQEEQDDKDDALKEEIIEEKEEKIKASEEFVKRDKINNMPASAIVILIIGIACICLAAVWYFISK